MDKHDQQLSKLRELMGMIESMSEISDTEILKLSNARYQMENFCLHEPKSFSGRNPPFVLRLETEMKKLSKALLPTGKRNKMVQSKQFHNFIDSRLFFIEIIFKFFL